MHVFWNGVFKSQLTDYCHAHIATCWCYVIQSQTTRFWPERNISVYRGRWPPQNAVSPNAFCTKPALYECSGKSLLCEGSAGSCMLYSCDKVENKCRGWWQEVQKTETDNIYAARNYWTLLSQSYDMYTLLYTVSHKRSMRVNRHGSEDILWQTPSFFQHVHQACSQADQPYKS